jgi:hypothetical protein
MRCLLTIEPAAVAIAASMPRRKYFACMVFLFKIIVKNCRNYPRELIDGKQCELQVTAVGIAYITSATLSQFRVSLETILIVITMT